MRHSASYQPHNHDQCVAQALLQAKVVCSNRGARMTPLRETVFMLVWQSHQPLTAYELLGKLVEQGHSAAPPTVYRALDFLQQLALVHRIDSLNAFIGCNQAGAPHKGCFMICRQCRNVHELAMQDPASQAISQAIAQAAAPFEFDVERVNIEISGLCAACRQQAAP